MFSPSYVNMNGLDLGPSNHTTRHVSPPRISPMEWADPEADEHSFTLLHSFWYITGALTLQGNTGHQAGAGAATPYRYPYRYYQHYCFFK